MLEQWQVGLIAAGSSLIGAAIGGLIAFLTNLQNNRRSDRRRFDQEIMKRMGQVLGALRMIRLTQSVPDQDDEQKQRDQRIRSAQLLLVLEAQDELRFLCRSGELSQAVYGAYQFYSMMTLGSEQHTIDAFNAYDKLIKAAQKELSIQAESGWTHLPDATIRSDQWQINKKSTPNGSSGE